jgi:Calcineurin-like phosphoesterase superfamily domain
VIACLYDIDGNLPALEAVLADAAAADRYVLGGDYALLGGWPAETVAGLRELEPAIWIRGNCERLTAESAPDDAIEACRAELLARVTPARLLFGHTHLPFRRIAGGVELVNPGSVGLPWDGDTRAAYALIHDDGRIEHRRVEYDVAASAAKVRALGPWAAPIAREIEQGRRVD